MKTHQEIRDVIQKFKLPLAAQDDLSDEFSDILDILHALNDRIEAIENGLNNCGELVVKHEQRLGAVEEHL